MRFYSRKPELQELEKTYKQIQEGGKMVVVTGRRRIGKTLLSLKHTEDKPHLYLFVAKKSEKLLCEEYIKQIKATFDVPIIGKISNFQDIFALLMEIGKKTPFVLVIDEFQEFLTINPSVFSDLQKLWDLHRAQSKVQVILLGSVYSLMHKIFEEKDEPLFGRADRILHLRPFPIQDIRNILSDYNQTNLNVLFEYYLFTGGTPKYIDTLVTNSVFSHDEIINFYLTEHSPFLDEGKNVLIEEFGKEYGVYFSILELISVGNTSRGEIESVLQKDIGGHLEKLEKVYSVISKYRPINAKPNSKLLKYQIKDHFLKFWFRFIYRNKTAIETGNFDYVKEVLEKNFSPYSGKILEQFFLDIYASTHRFNKIGSYWERGHQNEIDLVAINDLEKKMIVAEIKINKSKISLNKLHLKAQNLIRDYKDYDVQFLALSLEDAAPLIKNVRG